MSKLSLLVFTILFLGILNVPAQNNFTVVVHQSNLPANLNPLTSRGATERSIQACLFSTLLEYDPNTLKLRPQLAKDFPKITEIKEGKHAGNMSITYEIRSEANWDNGQAVTAYDYIFTVKALKNPLVKTGGMRPYYEFIEDIEVNANNPKIFTIYSKHSYFLAEESSGELHLMPEYAYDKQQILRKISISELNKPEDELKSNAFLKTFADEFNQKKYESEPKYIVGSNAYMVTTWSDQELILSKKKNWWGEKIKNVPALDLGPDEIIHRVYDKPLEAFKALKDGKIDAMPAVRPQFYLDLKSNPKFKKSFELVEPMSFSYAYIGFNTQNPILADKNVRRALAHLINRDEVIEALYHGMAKKVNSPISRTKSYYHKELQDIDYNPQKAANLLAESGWRDSDRDDILDKKINGKRTPLSLTYKYNKVNHIRKNIGLLLQMEGKKIGVEIRVEGYPWNEYLDQVHSGETEIFSIAWVMGPGLNDMKQIWHTSSFCPKGSNNSFFGNAETDKLIDEIRSTLDEEKRNALYRKMQEIIAEEQPYIFLFAPQYRIAISKKINNAQISSLAPGFQVRFFKPNRTP